ncbi:MAG TPA: DNA-processing protein DprA [Candidatus Limnocylindria bacterium]|nr:DNA-processing protein DprA [Candidatus Limnocylindria bacterium]
MKIYKISYNSDDFPSTLRHIPSPPKELYILGDLGPLLEKPLLAVVGSRKVTPYGRSITLDLVRAVASQRVVIISGMALGVDALAHQAALEVGGKTIAVLPCGLDKPYPATNRQLARKILEQGGVLMSEYPEGTPPLIQNFIARNRLESGMSDGVLITEAAIKSGTVHTARFALEQGKTVMAVPGNITSELSKGTNNLIRSGAVPVTRPEDIFEVLDIMGTPEDHEVVAANAEEAAILQLLKQGITDSSILQTSSQLEVVVFNQTLTMLELTGKIRPLGAGHWSLA